MGGVVSGALPPFASSAAPEAFWQAIQMTAGDFASLTVAGAIHNLIPVTIGNVIGGGVFVGIIYWFVYLRRR